MLSSCKLSTIKFHYFAFAEFSITNGLRAESLLSTAFGDFVFSLHFLAVDFITLIQIIIITIINYKRFSFSLIWLVNPDMHSEIPFRRKVTFHFCLVPRRLNRLL